MAADTPTRNNRMSVGDDNGPVTAARRNHNLETIRKQNGWEDFPECLPPAMRTTKGGKTTDFGNTKLRIIERIAVNATFADALAYFMVLTQDGSRILRLKDLEACADNFDKSTTSRSNRRVSGGRDSMDAADSDASPPQRSTGGEALLDMANKPDFSVERRSYRSTKAPPVQPTTPVKPVKTQVRSHDEISDDTMDTLPIHPGKRQRTGDALDFVIHPPIPIITVVSPHGRSGPQAVDLGNESTGDLPPPSPMRRVSIAGTPTRAFSNDPNIIFPSIDRAFDKLIGKVRGQHRLVYNILEHRKDIEARIAHPHTFGDLETELLTAKEAQSKARNDVDQAQIALDAMKAQYSEVDSSLSRALIATVTSELDKSNDAVGIARSEVERIESMLAQAQVQEESLPMIKEEVDHSVAQLQSQTHFWLQRLGEVGVELTNQLTALQSS